MQVKLTWSYATTPVETIPTQLVIKHKKTGESNAQYVTQTTINNISTVCNTTTGTCEFLYPAGVLSDNISYDFIIVTTCGSAGSAVDSNVVSRLNLICPSVTVTATQSTISYSFPGALNTSVTGYKVELVNSSNAVIATTAVLSVAATISGTFAGNSTPNDGIPDYTISASTAYTVRVTAYADNQSTSKVCNFPITTTNTPPCNGASNLQACICGVDCASC